MMRVTRSSFRMALKLLHRRKVIWNEHTKKYIQGAIERAAQDAANVISEQLDEDDFLTWVKGSEVIYKNTGNDSVLRQLGEMVDKENVKPKFRTGITFAAPGGILKGYKSVTYQGFGKMESIRYKEKK